MTRRSRRSLLAALAGGGAALAGCSGGPSGADDGGGTESPAGAEPGAMRARAWSVAANFHEPADYGIPPLPEWTVYREAGGEMALGADDGNGVFIAAEEPTDVRR